MSKVLVSGVKPTGRPHIGNYFGAMKQFVDLQDSYESRIFVANLHALTSLQDGEELEKLSKDVVLDYLGIGIDPEKATIYLQSDVPHVAELAWIFSCLTTMPELMRAHAFKDAEAKNKDINVGTFNYPLLMAADILAAGGEVVPVGKDQIQHIEMAREIARDFNNAYGETFIEPTKELILETTETVPGTDGQKMSKSYGNTIPLFGTDEEIDKAVMSIVTDSKPPTEPKDPGKDNVFALHKLFTHGPEFDELRDRYEAGDIGYKESKEILAKNVKLLIGSMRERRAEWESKPDEVDKIIRESGMKMRKIVHEKMTEVRKKAGLTHHE
jgi:tryptophanyl-tRNA synthetase